MRKKFVLLLVGILIIFFILIYSNSQNSIKNGKGIITLDFDDGLKSQYEIAFKEMQKYGYNGTLFLLANQTGFFEGRELMTFQEAKEMQDYGWEIGSHGMIHEFINEDNLYYQIVQSKNLLSSKGFVINSFACPKGCNESISDLRKIGEENYVTIRSLDWGENSLENYNSKKLSSKWVNNINTAEEVCNWLVDSNENNKWLILLFHGIDEKDNPNHPYDISAGNFKQILNCIDKIDMDVKTIREVLKNE